MAIETLQAYNPKHTLPIYTKITRDRQNDYRVGDEYEMRVEDPDRAEEKDGRPPFNYTHEAVLVAKEETELGEIPPALMAFDAHTKSRSEAVDRISIGSNKWGKDEEVVLLIFARTDKIQEFVTSEMEVIDPELSKEDYET